MKKSLLFIFLLIAVAVPSFGAVTISGYQATTGPQFFYSYTNQGNNWYVEDLGASTVVGALLLQSYMTTNVSYTLAGTYTLTIDYTTTPVLSKTDGQNATWTNLKVLNNFSCPKGAFYTVGFDAPVSLRAIRYSITNASDTVSGWKLSTPTTYSVLSQETVSPPTADTWEKINAIYDNTETIIANGGSGGSGGSPIDAVGSAASLAVPAELQPYIKPSEYFFVSGLAAVLSAGCIMFFWSKGML